jgi:hypothetical protein
MTKEKVQNKVQTIQWPKKKYKYFVFGHWIASTLFCTFSFAIGLSVLYFVLCLWPLDCLYFILYFFFGLCIVCTLFCTFSLVIGLPVLRFIASDYNIGIFK